MPANRFSDLVNKDISRFRRVGHSGTNYFRSIDRSSFGLGNVGGQVLNTAGNVGGVLGGVAGVATVAGAAVASGAFLAACAGPQVAITGAVVGLVLLAKGTYSNRESAHKELSKYVWSLVDDEDPHTPLTADNIEQAADAATTLLDDGKSQIKLIHSKLNSASAGLTTFITKMSGLLTELKTAQTVLDGMQSVTSISNLSAPPAYVAQQNTIGKKKKAIKDEWKTAQSAGGAIFEYVRRCSHTANYLQAAHVLAIAMREKTSRKMTSPTTVASTLPQPVTDYFEGSALRTETTRLFTLLDEAYKEMEKATA